MSKDVRLQVTTTNGDNRYHLVKTAIALSAISHEVSMSPSPGQPRVVLVRPQIAANIGSVARLVSNFGWRDLVLVDPVGDHLGEEARRLACRGEDILDATRVVATLEEAIADCVWVVATAARTGRLERGHAGPPEVILADAQDWLRAGPIAVVFGPEPSGLTTTEVMRAHALVNIPTAPDNPALNLAAAAAIVLAQLSRATMAPADAAPRSVATFAEQERMFALLRESLLAAHFLYGDKADVLMHGLRQLIVRAGPSPHEVRILIGLARQVAWLVERCPPE